MRHHHHLLSYIKYRLFVAKVKTYTWFQSISSPKCPVKYVSNIYKSLTMVVHIPHLWFDLSILEFFLNVSLNSVNLVTKIFAITVKGLEPATSCVRDQDATIAPARHMWETESLNWAQSMLQLFIRFPEFTEFNESSAPLRKSSIFFINNRKSFRLVAQLFWKMLYRTVMFKITITIPMSCQFVYQILCQILCPIVMSNVVSNFTIITYL